MRRREYAVDSVPIADRAEFERYLNAKGEEGWDLVFVDISDAGEDEPQAVVVL